MRYGDYLRLASIAVVLTIAGFLGSERAAAQDDGGRRIVNPYSHSEFDNNAAGMLDAINRRHASPAPRPPAVYQRPGRIEVNPYDYRKYKYDSTGLIDAINRDHPGPRGPSQPPAVRQSQGRVEVNPYDYRTYMNDPAGMFDAINRDHPRSRGPASNNR